MVVDVGVQVSGIEVRLSERDKRFMCRSGEGEINCVGARLGEREIAFESVCTAVAAGQRSVGDTLEQELAGGGDDGAVIVKSAINSSRLDVRRNQNCGDADAEAREVKRRIERVGIARPVLVVRIHGRRRRNVVVEAAVLVVDDNQESGLAQGLVFPDGVEGIADKNFALLDVVIRVLVAGGEKKRC